MLHYIRLDRVIMFMGKLEYQREHSYDTISTNNNNNNNNMFRLCSS